MDMEYTGSLTWKQEGPIYAMTYEASEDLELSTPHFYNSFGRQVPKTSLEKKILHNQHMNIRLEP